MPETMEEEMHASTASLDSQEQLEAALRDLMHQSGQQDSKAGRSDHVGNFPAAFINPTFCKGWCRGEPITEAGKRRQMAKMLTLILTPITVLMAVSLYFVSENFTAKMESDKIRKTVLFSVEVGKVIHAMQRERDMSVLYLSSIGPETKTFLTKRYLETDEQVANLGEWPTNLVNYELPQFDSKRAFQQYLTRHRNELDLLNHTLYDEIVFYTDNIRVFVRWLYDSIKESKYGTIWKTLVAYQKVIEAKENVGIERALGSAYFSLGGFVSQAIYEWYNEKLHAFRANIRSASRYSPLVEPIANARINSGGSNLTDAIEIFRYVIQRRKISQPSLVNATLYFDNMTIYIDLVFLAQSDLALEIVQAIDNRAATVTTGVAISSVIIMVVFVMCPLLVKTVRGLTNDIQSYALTLADKTKQLNREKQRTDSLLYQMLPKSVAEQLKQKKEVNAEYFKEVTIFFSDIVDFTRIVTECSPIEIVNMLNNLYTLFDGRIDLYDVYKVETINDSYMVASGLPRLNGNRHATEIANMALDLLMCCGELLLDFVPAKKIKLRIGIHSGPCVAGVVGSKLPRYCLFGDTVNTASRMQTHGQPNLIHISSTTSRLLAKSGGYMMKMRGLIDIKGKGRMVTYWLLDRMKPSPVKNKHIAGQNSVSELKDNKTPLDNKDPKDKNVKDAPKNPDETVIDMKEDAKDVKEVKDAKNVTAKDVKENKDVKNSNVKDVKDAKEPKDVKEVKEAKAKDARDAHKDGDIKVREKKVSVTTGKVSALAGMGDHSTRRTDHQIPSVHHPELGRKSKSIIPQLREGYDY